MVIKMANISGWRIVKMALKTIVLIIIVGTVGLLLWRIFSSGDPIGMKTLKANDTLLAAWDAAAAEGESLTMFTQIQPTTITTATHNYNYFAVSNVVFIPDAEQVQLTFRYTNSTIRHLTEDKGLSEVPDRHEDLFDVTLWAVYDLTPEVKGDDENVEYVRFHPTASLTEADTKNLYNYRRLVFDGVDMTSDEKPLLSLFMDVYYVGDIDYEADPYGTLPLYQYVYTNVAYEVTEEDLKALGRS